MAMTAVLGDNDGEDLAEVCGAGGGGGYVREEVGETNEERSEMCLGLSLTGAVREAVVVLTLEIPPWRYKHYTLPASPRRIPWLQTTTGIEILLERHGSRSSSGVSPSAAEATQKRIKGSGSGNGKSSSERGYSLGIDRHTQYERLILPVAENRPRTLLPPQNGQTTHYSLSLDDESKPYLKIATECLHAQDYVRMLQILGNIHVVNEAVEFGRGIAYFKLKQYRNASTHFSKLEELGLHNTSGQGNVSLANFYLGEICVVHTKLTEAADRFSRAVTFYSTESVAKSFKVIPPTLSGLYLKLATTLRNGSKVMAAIQAYKNAIAHAESKRDEQSAHMSLGNLYQSLGENSSALAEYEHAIKLSEELQDYVSVGWAHGNMGNAYLGLHQKDKAVFHLEKSLEMAIEHEPTPQAIGRAYNNLGTAYQALNELQEASNYYDLSLSQAIYGNDKAGQARVYGNIGNLLMIQKKYDSALVHYTETLALSTDKSTRSTAYHNRGCAGYEKAESDKKRLLQRTDSNGTHPSGKFAVTFHGDELDDVEVEYQLPILPDSTLSQYRQASKDLVNVVEFHEETFQTIKGSAKGLTLSVSLFESNCRTFHRLQDCLYNLGEFKKALVYAEQSRARTLGELLLQKKARKLDTSFTPPLNLDQICQIVQSQEHSIVYISYTGARLLVWVLVPREGRVSVNMLQVALEDDQFAGKSLDYYLRYSLAELLVEKTMEMYEFCSYDESADSPVAVLHNVIGKPLLKIFKAVQNPSSHRKIQDVILIPDSYTNLMPIVALLDTVQKEFLGDRFRFRIMPSLLTMGIMNQLPPSVVQIPEDSKSFCVVGNPTIPIFNHQGETWNLGKLPFATEEAEWVAHILHCNPTLHEEATKPVVLSMIKQAKVIHLATHGSAVAGFLAFSGLKSSRNGDVVDEHTVLVYPQDIEHMDISPALVVLSSCDSGRGTVKADGIIGMARAFILAGAQAVLTTLWRVPDESAAIFMQFLYQYLMDGLRGSVALHKAILSLRCFSKYSGFIHWSGYQLTGREIEFRIEMSPEDKVVVAQAGHSTVFPRLEIVKNLEKVFLKEPNSPTDVQLVQGSYGLKPTEPVVDFIAKNHTHFTGGIFWLSGSCPELTEAAEQCMRKTLSSTGTESSTQPLLIVFDNIESLPQSEFLLNILKNYNTHIIISTNFNAPIDKLKKEIDRQLLRGCDVIAVKPLSVLHSTQRIVHSVMKESYITPFNIEQKILERLAEKAHGAPSVIDISSSLLQRCAKGKADEEEEEEKERRSFLEEFASMVDLSPSQSPEKQTTPPPSAEREDDGSSVAKFTSQLIDAFKLPTTDYFLLCSLSLFGSVPVPRGIVEMTQSLVMTAKFGKHCREANESSMSNLLSAKFLRVYPSAVIVSPTATAVTTSAESSKPACLQLQTEPRFYYVPEVVRYSLWEKMEEVDIVFSITMAYKALQKFSNLPKTDETLCEQNFATGLCKILKELCERNAAFIDLPCYKEVYRLYLAHKTLGVGELPLGEER